MGLSKDGLRTFLFGADTSQTCYMSNAYYPSHDFMRPKQPGDLIPLSTWQHFKESLVHFSPGGRESML